MGPVTLFPLHRPENFAKFLQDGRLDEEFTFNPARMQLCEAGGGNRRAHQDDSRVRRYPFDSTGQFNASEAGNQEVDECEIEPLGAGRVGDASGATFIFVEQAGDFAAFVAEQSFEVLKHRSVAIDEQDLHKMARCSRRALCASRSLGWKTFERALRLPYSNADERYYTVSTSAHSMSKSFF